MFITFLQFVHGLLQRHAAPCDAMPCHAMPCNAKPYCMCSTPIALPCHRVLRKLCRAALVSCRPCLATSHAVAYHACSCHAAPCHAMADVMTQSAMCLHPRAMQAMSCCDMCRTYMRCQTGRPTCYLSMICMRWQVGQAWHVRHGAAGLRCREPLPSCCCKMARIARGWATMLHYWQVSRPSAMCINIALPASAPCLADLPAGDRHRPRDMALCRILAALHEAAVSTMRRVCEPCSCGACGAGKPAAARCYRYSNCSSSAAEAQPNVSIMRHTPM